MGGPNLEVFKFGMYILFPIGVMYYFGTNLDSRFRVPDFWPKEGQTHTIPFEKEDIKEELERLRQRRLAVRARRLELEARGENKEVTRNMNEEMQHPRPNILEQVKLVEPEMSRVAGVTGKGWFGWSR